MRDFPVAVQKKKVSLGVSKQKRLCPAIKNPPRRASTVRGAGERYYAAEMVTTSLYV